MKFCVHSHGRNTVLDTLRRILNQNQLITFFQWTSSMFVSICRFLFMLRASFCQFKFKRLHETEIIP